MEGINREHEPSRSASLVQVVSFELGKEVFAVDILQVQEIIRMIEVTRVPEAPECVEGVINLRGKVIPVVDLRKRFHLPIPEENPQERIIVIKQEKKPVGMIVDAVSEVLRFAKDSVEPAPSMVSNVDSQFITGVAKIEGRLLLLLDVRKFISSVEQKDS